jgi:hypothetical protein
MVNFHLLIQTIMLWPSAHLNSSKLKDLVNPIVSHLQDSKNKYFKFFEVDRAIIVTVHIGHHGQHIITIDNGT